MKIAMLTAFLLTIGSVGAQAAELKFFSNYDPATQTYTKVDISTTANPLSIEMMTDTTTGACYLGQPSEVLALIGTMMDLGNAEQSRIDDGTALTYTDLVTSEIYTGDAINLTAEFNIKSRAEMVTITWPRIRQCTR